MEQRQSLLRRWRCSIKSALYQTPRTIFRLKLAVYKVTVELRYIELAYLELPNFLELKPISRDFAHTTSIIFTRLSQTRFTRIPRYVELILSVNMHVKQTITKNALLQFNY